MNIRSKVGATALAIACLLGLAQASYANEERDHAQLTFAEAQSVAPNFVGVSNWLNSGPLSITDLRGKVVLVDFWTYGCINCTRTLPYVTKLYDTYKERGLVVVGVHTPEFPFEKVTGNVHRDQAPWHQVSGRARQRLCDVERLPQSVLAGAVHRRPKRKDRLRAFRRRPVR